MTMTTPEQIARKLTKAQRRRLINASGPIRAPQYSRRALTALCDDRLAVAVAWS